MQSCSELGQRLVARWELVEKSQDEQQAKSNNSGRGRREGVCSLGGQQKVCWSGGKADQRNASASTEARAGTGEVAGRDDELGEDRHETLAGLEESGDDDDGHDDQIVVVKDGDMKNIPDVSAVAVPHT